MKYCSDCDKEKPLDEFVKNASKPDGLGRYCLLCHRLRVQMNRARDKDSQYKWKRWAEEEIDWLIENYAGADKEVILERLPHRTWRAVKAKMAKVRKEMRDNVYLNRRAKDLRNKRFGKLKVIDPLDERSSVGNQMWKCRCSCGEVTKVSAKYLLNGDTKSCGCLSTELLVERSKLPEGEAAFNQVIHAYKKGARYRDLEWDLTNTQARELLTTDCHYCGSPPSNVSLPGWAHGEFVYNGIDRKDNDCGYTVDNTVPCCSRCNLAKGEMGYKEFIQWIRQACQHLEEKGL